MAVNKCIIILSYIGAPANSRALHTETQTDYTIAEMTWAWFGGGFTESNSSEINDFLL